VRVSTLRSLALCLILLLALPLEAWGPRGHELVNQYAIQTLPPELRPFFQAHREWLVANASAPDNWKENDPEEEPHHFIDIERYARRFEKMPASREEAVQALGADYVRDSGDLVWYLPLATHKLAAALRARDRDQILHWAVAVAHYAADVCQPLHTTENYDGQLTGQTGVHSRFESLAVSRAAGSLTLDPKPARPLPDVFNAVFAQITRSYRLVDDVLQADRRAAAADPRFDITYASVMASQTRELIRQQVEAGATLTGSLWLTAWIEAGRPDLSGLAAER
jgi:hypothetical protein